MSKELNKELINEDIEMIRETIEKIATVGYEITEDDYDSIIRRLNDIKKRIN